MTWLLAAGLALELVVCVAGVLSVGGSLGDLPHPFGGVRPGKSLRGKHEWVEGRRDA